MNEHEPNAGLPVDEQLEARLAGLTEWTGPASGPVERAMIATGLSSGRSMGVRAGLARVARRGAGLKAAVLARLGGAAVSWRGLSRGDVAAIVVVGTVGLIAASAMLPSVRGSRPADVTPNVTLGYDTLADIPGNPGAVTYGGVIGSDGGAERASAMYKQRNYDVADGWAEGDRTALLGDIPALDLQASFFGVNGRGESMRFGESKARVEEAQPSPQAQQSPTRQIIRRGQVDLVVADVQIAFRKAQDLIKPERGEFIQDTVLAGAGQAMTARVVLRVDPARLPEVMQASRGLGELASEQTGGDDVTDRLTDLDAQIRNEQRVEKEMLALFDLRKDAPLKDVLELREQLARVRGTIEKLQAQQAQTQRLVALASLAITLRPQPDKTVAPPPVNETPSFTARVGQEVSRSWDRATNTLASSAGWAVEKAVGGLPLWTTLGVTGYILWRIVRRRKKPEASPQSR